MPGRMKADPYATLVDESTVRQRVDGGRRPQSRAQHFLTGLCRQVAAAARLGVVCMGVRDDRALDGIPGIDIEIPRLTIKAVARRLNEW